MSNPKLCRHETLARNGVAHVQRCTHCGCVSIHLGPVSVRLDDAGLEALWVVLGEANVELQARGVAGVLRSVQRGIA